jgi:preprotein translocase subunit SecA
MRRRARDAAWRAWRTNTCLGFVAQPHTHALQEADGGAARQRADDSQGASSSGRDAAASELAALASPNLVCPSFRDTPLAAARHWLRRRVDNSERTVWRLVRDAVTPTNAIEASMRALTDEELAAVTPELRARLAAGASLDSLLPDAFAAVREAARRALGLRHYDVQLIGGAVLHEGAIAEMRTGEGKTLVATLAAYLNALPGGGVHVVTVNDYLASRDAAWMGRVYRALGMTCGCVASTTPADARAGVAGYGADVTYVTNSELGFDYLRDNMAQSAGELLQTRPFAFALVDEVDSVLIDEGRNPLLISTVQEEGADRYPAAHAAAGALREGEHYTLDRKARGCALTEAGMAAAEAVLGVEDLWAGAEPWAKFVLNAIRAKELYLRDVHYIVRDGEVQIVDEFTGRVMPRRRWTDNIHQAVEAKEGVTVQGEQVTAATITYQSFFKLYPKLGGMTGTARTEDEEFWRLYRLDVVSIPTHAPCIRVDMPTAIFRTAGAKWAAVADFIADAHWGGAPVLVGTTSVEHSELLSGMLSRYKWEDALGRPRVGVPHNLLNARAQYAAQEAAIIAQAGRSGAVTIATNMAGRGTDILLGGSPLGLVRAALSAALWPALGLGDPPALLAASVSPPLRHSTTVALAAAAAAAGARWRGDAALSVEEASALLDRVMERAESGSAPTVASAQPTERGLAAAALAALTDCRAACAEDAARVRALGGLQVVGTQIHESRRIDNQLRGRAGRQGDPGRTQFVLSLEDELIAVHCPEWATRPLWDLAGIPDDAPVSSALVDREVSAIQVRIERYYAGTRRAVAEYDEVLSLHRSNAYKLRRALLLDGPVALRERVFRYTADLVDDAAARAGVRAGTPPAQWDVGALLEECRGLTAGRADRLRLDAGHATEGPHHLLPGVSAADLTAALTHGTPLPRGHALPPVDAHPAALAAALAGVPWRTAGESDDDDADDDAANAAAAAVVGARIAARVDAQSPLRGGRWALQAALLRAYLIEHAIALFEDRSERLRARGVLAEELDAAERLWVLRALDEHWQRHISSMAVLRNSVNLRAFGLMEPLEEYNIDGARAFAELVTHVRRRAVQYMYFFVDTTTTAADPGEVGAVDAAAGDGDERTV